MPFAPTNGGSMVNLRKPCLTQPKVLLSHHFVGGGEHKTIAV
jgi:hypothetical protein